MLASAVCGKLTALPAKWKPMRQTVPRSSKLQAMAKLPVDFANKPPYIAVNTAPEIPGLINTGAAYA
jgi:hypothetical protein